MLKVSGSVYFFFKARVRVLSLVRFLLQVSGDRVQSLSGCEVVRLDHQGV
jgi:hypothetical protein